MDRSRHVRVAINLTDAAMAHKRTRRHPRRNPEGVITVINNTECIDLPDHRPTGVNEHRPFKDALAQKFFRLVVTIKFLVQCFEDMVNAHHVVLRYACPVIRLAQQIRHVAQTHAQLILIADQTRTIFDHLRHRAAIKGTQFLFGATCGNEQRVLMFVLIRARHLTYEIGFHFEDRAEIFIEVQQVVVNIG